jgi:hypothetical protein
MSDKTLEQLARKAKAGAATLQRILALAEDAAKAQPFVAHVAPGAVEPHGFSRAPAGMSAILRLSDDYLPDLIDADGRVIRTPFAAPAGGSLRLDAAIAAASRVAQAGAHIILHSNTGSDDAVGAEGVIGVRRQYSELRCVEAAQFSVVADDADVAVSDLPTLAARIDWETAPSMAVRFEVPRSELRNPGLESIAAEIMAAVTLGVARAADRLVLQECAASAAAGFTLAAAAARGLKFDELRGFSCLDGAGAVGPDGRLRVAGIPAELSGDCAVSVVGSFSRCGIAIHDEIVLHLERRGLSGGLTATALITAQALVPSGVGAFWTFATGGGNQDIISQ